MPADDDAIICVVHGPRPGRAGDLRGNRTFDRRRAAVRADGEARDARAGRGVRQEQGHAHALARGSRRGAGEARRRRRRGGARERGTRRAAFF